ncbi:MAG TPA: 3-oxoacyl-ACP synthase [Spirochaetia bacterium]|nr:MAG: 3-oxoacyl-ACP synthase [Spirochaetes bacterium GWB1_36_13]HCL57826.1 3-oxoacyl-ACP synthase [Spirochaetia bacterium]
MIQLRGVEIAGTGHYLPEKILTNEYFEKIVDTTDEWITSRTGMKKRHVVVEGENNSDIAVKAAQNALDMAGLKAQDIDMILFATVTPDMVFPATACLVQNKLGCRTIPALDFEVACSGFVYGLSMGYNFIASGAYNTILVIGSEVLTRITDYTDRNTCVLFGDGAGAVILRPSEKNKILGYHLGSDGGEAKILYQPAGGSAMLASHETVDRHDHSIRMAGQEVFRIAVNRMIEGLDTACKNAGLTPSDLDFIIPHQANTRIMQAVRKFAKLNPEQLIVTIEEHANTSSSTIPIALDMSVRSGKIKRGNLIGITAFGGGLTWGGAVFEF